MEVIEIVNLIILGMSGFVGAMFGVFLASKKSEKITPTDTPMSDVILTGEFNAEIWTDVWLKTIERSPSIPTDKGTMIGWFANAIMAGYDHAYQEMAEGEGEAG